jgi:hypothetical protein
MHPDTLLEVRRTIRSSEHHALRQRAAGLLRAPDRAAIDRILATL